MKQLTLASGNGGSDTPAITADGHFVAFASMASDLVARDNNTIGVYVRNRLAGVTELISVARGGEQANGNGSVSPAISADGRFTAFHSDASNLVAADTNHVDDVFLRDRLKGTAERLSVASGGRQANGASEYPAISADGRFVAFDSEASNLVADDTNQCEDAYRSPHNCGDVFVRDRLAGTTERVSVSSDGAQANDDSYVDAISADGRFVVFASRASSLVAGDTNAAWDVFLRDRLAGTTERVSVGAGSAQSNGDSSDAAISRDGRFIAFSSGASNLVGGDTNTCGNAGRSPRNCGDIFVRDRLAGTTERVSVATGGGQANGDSGWTSISADGRFVAFTSWASNLVAGDSNSCESDEGPYNCADVFVHDRLAGTTERISVSSGGGQANDESEQTAISADGRFVAFTSWASNLVADDTNADAGDVFVRDRLKGTIELISARRELPQAGRLALRPWPARAGKRLNATMPLSAGGDSVASARIACTATLGGRKLPASGRSFRASTVRCTWKIPPNARGKRITGSVAASTAYGTASRRFTGTVG